jgi:hypothetical protein
MLVNLLRRVQMHWGARQRLATQKSLRLENQGTFFVYREQYSEVLVRRRSCFLHLPGDESIGWQASWALI